MLSKYPLINSLFSFIIIGIFILWEYFHGGVVTHHLLADENLPGISNYWGLLTVPLLAWTVTVFVGKRKKKALETGDSEAGFDRLVFKRLLLGIVFGLVAGLLWEFQLEHILQYYILLPLVISLFIPLCYLEYLLGFVLGMAFTFGGILPMLIGSILFLLSFILHKISVGIVGLVRR